MAWSNCTEEEATCQDYSALGINVPYVAFPYVAFVADPVISFSDMLESVEEVQAILLVLEYGLFLITAGGDMIDSAGVFYA